MSVDHHDLHTNSYKKGKKVLNMKIIILKDSVLVDLTGFVVSGDNESGLGKLTHLYTQQRGANLFFYSANKQ